MSDDRRLVYSGQYLDVVLRGTWEYCERKKLSGIVGLIPITDDDRLVLVDQYRIPVGKRVIELPAGLVGDEDGAADESLETAARRELLEETGYEAGKLTWAFEGVSTPGLSDESVHFFVATELRRVHAGGGTADEDIVVCEVPLTELIDWLAAQYRQGKAIDVKVYSALTFGARGR